jgi:hypothetical protein
LAHDPHPVMAGTSPVMANLDSARAKNCSSRLLKNDLDGKC